MAIDNCCEIGRYLKDRKIKNQIRRRGECLEGPVSGWSLICYAEFGDASGREHVWVKPRLATPCVIKPKYNVYAAQCPTRQALDRIADKWTASAALTSAVHPRVRERREKRRAIAGLPPVDASDRLNQYCAALKK
jgi:hypothetical protein